MQILPAPATLPLRRSEIRIPNQSENLMKSAVQSERGGREEGGVVGARTYAHVQSAEDAGWEKKNENTVVSFHFKETVTVK